MLITLHGYDNSLAPGIDPNMKGYDFTNRIKSSMVFEADSEIALVNATIERVIEYTVTAASNSIELDTKEVGGVIIVTIPAGNYTSDTLQDALQTGLNNANTHGYSFSIVYDNTDPNKTQWKINWIYTTFKTEEGAVNLDVNTPLFSLGGANGGTWTWTPAGGGAAQTDFKIVRYGGVHQWSWVAATVAGGATYYIKEQIDATGAIVYPWSTTEATPYTDATTGRMLITEALGKSVLTFNTSAGALDSEVTNNTEQNILSKSARATAAFDAGTPHAKLTLEDQDFTNWDGNHSFCVFGASETLVGWEDLTYKPSSDDLGSMCFFQSEDEFDPATMNYTLTIGLDVSDATGRLYQRAWIEDGVVDNAANCDGCQFRLKQDGTMEAREAGVKLITAASAPTLDMTKKPGLAIALAGTDGFVRYFYRTEPTAEWDEVRMAHPTPASKKKIVEIFPTVAIPFVSVEADGAGFDANLKDVAQIAGSTAIAYKTFPQDYTSGKEYNSKGGKGIVDWVPVTAAGFSWRMPVALVRASATQEPTVLQPDIPSFFDFRLANQTGVSDTATVNLNHQVGLMKRAVWSTYSDGDLFINSTDFEVRFIFEPTNVRIFHTPTSAVVPIHTELFSNILPSKNTTLFRIIRNTTPSGTADVYQFGYMDETDASNPVFKNLVEGVYGASSVDLVPVFQTKLGASTIGAPEGGIQDIAIGYSDFDTTDQEVIFRPRGMGSLLGFELPSYTEDDGGVGFESDKTPNDNVVGCVNPEIHVQLANLPVQSLNGYTHREEKTIAVIPRYKTDDTSQSGLNSLYYHGCDWLLYSPLFFKHRTNLNEIHVKLTNYDGTPAVDVDCCSLTLDIRPRVST